MRANIKYLRDYKDKEITQKTKSQQTLEICEGRDV